MIRRYTLPEMGALWSERGPLRAHARGGDRGLPRPGPARAGARGTPSRPSRPAPGWTWTASPRSRRPPTTTSSRSSARSPRPSGPRGGSCTWASRAATSWTRRSRSSSARPGERLLAGADRLVTALIARARAEAGTVMMGRTHSVHAEPTTFGLKCAGWAFEVARGRERLAAATAEIATGKISGPVGTYSHLAPDLEAEVLADLGLRVDPVSTQIVQRDRHAAFLAAIAILGGSLERLATEVRNLQHTEIAEVMEPFKRGQKGSSAMPHKRNPILSERIAGLARLLRGYAQTAFENQPLWHERDISHSSAERVILPDATILLDYMLAKTTGLVEGLVVRPERMRENIERGLGLHASSRVLLALVEQGRPGARGGLRDRPAQRAARGRRARPAPGPAGDGPGRRGEAAAGRARRLLRRRRGPASRARGHRPPRRPGGGDPGSRAVHARPRRRCPMLAAERVRALGQGPRPVPRSTTSGCCWSPRTGCPRSTWCMPTPIPDKGRVLTAPVPLLVRRDGGHRGQPPALARDPADLPPSSSQAAPGVADELRGRMMIGRLAEVLPVECVVRGYLSGLGLEGVPGRRRGVRRPAPAGPPRERPPPRADLHAGLEGARRHPRREHPVRPGRGAHRPRAGAPGPRGVARALPPRRRRVRAGRDHPRRHQVRVRRPARRAS